MALDTNFTLPLAFNQIADAVNRRASATKKPQTEAMRLGFSDPEEFSRKYAKELSDQQNYLSSQIPKVKTVEEAPSSLSPVTTPTTDIPSWVNQSQPTTPEQTTTPVAVPTIGAQPRPPKRELPEYQPKPVINQIREFNPVYGIQNMPGYTTKDIGKGIYDILNQQGEVLGQGYKGISDSIRELYQDVKPTYSPYQKTESYTTRAPAPPPPARPVDPDLSAPIDMYANWLAEQEYRQSTGLTENDPGYMPPSAPIWNYQKQMNSYNTAMDNYNKGLNNLEYTTTRQVDVPQWLFNNDKFSTEQAALDQKNVFLNQMLTAPAAVQNELLGQLLTTGNINGLIPRLNEKGEYNSYLNDWEALQSGKPFNMADYQSPLVNSSLHATWQAQPDMLDFYRSMGGNQRPDAITGRNTLYGSDPVFLDGKLAGYTQNFDLDPWTTNWDHAQTKDNNQPLTGSTLYKWDSGIAGMGRQYTPEQQEWYKQNAFRDPNTGKIIVPNTVADQAAGWNNVDEYKREYGEQDVSKGLLKSFWDYTAKAGKIILPIENYVTRDVIGYDTFRKVAPWVVNYFVPGLGSAISAADNLSLGNKRGAALDAVSAAMPYAAPVVNSALGAAGSVAGDALSSLGELLPSGFSEGLGAIKDFASSVPGSVSDFIKPALDPVTSSLSEYLGENVVKAAGEGLTGGLKNAGLATLAGEDPKKALVAALYGGLGAGLGAGVTDQLGSMLGDSNIAQTIAKGVGGAASGALNSLFSNGDPVRGSLYGAMSGGLHGYLNSALSPDLMTPSKAKEIQKLTNLGTKSVNAAINQTPAYRIAPPARNVVAPTPQWVAMRKQQIKNAANTGRA